MTPQTVLDLSPAAPGFYGILVPTLRYLRAEVRASTAYGVPYRYLVLSGPSVRKWEILPEPKDGPVPHSFVLYRRSDRPTSWQAVRRETATPGGFDRLFAVVAEDEAAEPLPPPYPQEIEDIVAEALRAGKDPDDECREREAFLALIGRTYDSVAIRQGLASPEQTALYKEHQRVLARLMDYRHDAAHKERLAEAALDGCYEGIPGWKWAVERSRLDSAQEYVWQRWGWPFYAEAAPRDDQRPPAQEGSR